MAQKKSTAIALLKVLGFLLPGNWLKTFFYLNFVCKPRRLLRMAALQFYRFDHVYAVLKEARRKYDGNLAILEFGTNEGYAFRKLLYATKYLGLDDRVACHGFDTFEGIPAPADRKDLNIVADRTSWSEGQFKGGFEQLEGYCRKNYENFRLHRGLFEDTLTEEFIGSLQTSLPVLIWIDCDFYSSTKSVFENIIPILPTGCVIYFDEFEFNYGSRFTGEARIVYEINDGAFGEGIELVLDRELSMNSQRVYRFIRFEGGPHYKFKGDPYVDEGRSPTNDSPLP